MTYLGAPIIQTLWVGENLSIMEQLSISSFLQHGHAVHLYIYDEVKGVPKGTNLKDANEIIPSERIFKYKRQDSYAGFANLFRYKLLFEKGGYWVDSDVVCLKPFQFEPIHMFARDRGRRRPLDWLRKRYHVSNWFIRAPTRSKIMYYCYREALKRDPEKLVWGETGPRLITTAVNKFRMQGYIAPQGTFFPIDAWQWKQLVNDSFIANQKWRTAGQSCYAVHLYNDMWRRNNIDKNASFPKHSIYERLKRLYLIGK